MSDLWVIEVSTNRSDWRLEQDLTFTEEPNALEARTLVARSNPGLDVRVAHYRRYSVSPAVRAGEG